MAGTAKASSPSRKSIPTTTKSRSPTASPSSKRKAARICRPRRKNTGRTRKTAADARAAGKHACVKSHGIVNAPPEAVFRIFQESLTNVARHAQAKTVMVQLHADTARVTLEIQDDGRGIAPEAVANDSSLGLLGMRERALVPIERMLALS